MKIFMFMHLSYAPIEILEVLAKDKDWRVRAVQMNQKNL